MALPASLLKVRFSDPPRAHEVLRAQDNTGTLLDQVAAVPILSGVAINGVVLGATAVNVSHGLGRAWTNWLVTNSNANATVWNSSTANATKVLTLTASGAVTVNLWVW